VRLRWRTGTDVGTAGAGWFIDDLALRNGFVCEAAPCQADLALTKTASPVPVVTGSNLAYRLGVTDNGPARATDVAVSDATPAGTTFRSLSSPAPWACTTPIAGGTGAVECTNPSLEPHDGATFVLTVNVDCALRDGTTITNSAQVSGSRPDPDGSNNTAAISVRASNPAPAISAVSADPSVLWPPNHQFVSVTIDYSVSDNCGPLTNVLSVTSNEPPDAKGDGNTEPDFKVVDAQHVLLRAERSGRGNGRIYTITVTSTDSAGGSSQSSTTVTVPHDKGH
jgi:uncharacterized repeat protein (TIGR01451 family)